MDHNHPELAELAEIVKRYPEICAEKARAEALMHLHQLHLLIPTPAAPVASPQGECLLNTKEAAKLLGISSRTVRRWRDEGTLRPARGHSNYYTREELDQLAETRKGGR